MSAIKKWMIYIVLIAVAIYLTFPFVWLLSTSFKGQMETIFPNPPQWIPESPTFENYQMVFIRVNMFRSLLNSALITVIGIFFNVFTAALAAYPLARIDFRGKKVVFGLIMATLMIPIQGTMIVNYITLKHLGLIDQFLGVVLPSAVNVIGIVILKATYEGVPTEMEEAARVDGCGEFKLWLRVMMPIIKPALAAVSILAFVYYWNDFMWPLIIIKDPDKYPLQVALSRLESVFQTNFRYVTAGAVLSMLPILLFFALTQRFFIEGTKGAVKG